MRRSDSMYLSESALMSYSSTEYGTLLYSILATATACLCSKKTLQEENLPKEWIKIPRDEIPIFNIEYDPDKDTTSIYCSSRKEIDSLVNTKFYSITINLADCLDGDEEEDVDIATIFINKLLDIYTRLKKVRGDRKANDFLYSLTRRPREEYYERKFYHQLTTTKNEPSGLFHYPTSMDS